MKFVVTTSTPTEPIQSVILNELIAPIEPTVRDVKIVSRVGRPGELSVETVCLVIATATPVVALLYQVWKDWLDRRDNQVGHDGEKKVVTLSVNLLGKSHKISRDEDALALDVEISNLKPLNDQEIQVTIERTSK